MIWRSLQEPRDAGSPQKLGKAKDTCFHWSLQKEPALRHSLDFSPGKRMLASGLQNCRRIDFCRFKSLKFVIICQSSNRKLIQGMWVLLSPKGNWIFFGCSLEGPMLKLKLQCIGHLMRKVDSLEKTLMLGKTEGRRRSGWQRMRWLDGISDSMDMSLCKLWKIVKDRKPGVLQSTGSQRIRQDWATEQQQQWVLRALNGPLFNCFHLFIFQGPIVCVCMCVCALCCVRLFATPHTIAC